MYGTNTYRRIKELVNLIALTSYDGLLYLHSVAILRIYKHLVYKRTVNVAMTDQVALDFKHIKVDEV